MFYARIYVPNVKKSERSWDGWFVFSLLVAHLNDAIQLKSSSLATLATLANATTFAIIPFQCNQK